MFTVDIRQDFILWEAPPGGAVVDIEKVAAIIADHLEQMAARYPAEVFSDEGKTPDGIAGTALRVVLTNEAARLRQEVDQ